MRFGYSAWGFLGDQKFENGKEVSTPDGNATYSWSILWEMMCRGHLTYWMQRDRDADGWTRLGGKLFSSFSEEKRSAAYVYTQSTWGCQLPELDVLLLEWRFPIPGRNTVLDRDKPWYQPDLERQTQLLEHYGRTKTKIIAWDLDHKLLAEEERLWHPDAIFETSVIPRHQVIRRTQVEPPFVMDDLLQHRTLPADPKRKLVYVGSRYERDDVIERYLAPVKEGVELWGKWDDEAKVRWPHFSYHGRITPDRFREAYGSAGACPLLAKESYLRTGFVTPRPWEALLFGTITVGLAEHVGIERYVDPSCIAKDGKDLDHLATLLVGISPSERAMIRECTAHSLYFMDVRHFVDRVEEVVNNGQGIVDHGPVEHPGSSTGRKDEKEKGD